VDGDTAGGDAAGMGLTQWGRGGDGDRDNGDGWGWEQILVPVQLSRRVSQKLLLLLLVGTRTATKYMAFLAHPSRHSKRTF